MERIDVAGGDAGICFHEKRRSEDVAFGCRVGPACQQARPVNWRNRRVRNQKCGVRLQPSGLNLDFAPPLFQPERIRGALKHAECWGYRRMRRAKLLSTKQPRRVGAEMWWLPGVDSNCDSRPGERTLPAARFATTPGHRPTRKSRSCTESREQAEAELDNVGVERLAATPTDFIEWRAFSY
jgi:hypothetical protein